MSWVMFERTQAMRSASVPGGRGSPAATSLASTPNLATESPKGSKAASSRSSTVCRKKISFPARAPGANSFIHELYSWESNASSPDCPVTLARAGPTPAGRPRAPRGRAARKRGPDLPGRQPGGKGLRREALGPGRPRDRGGVRMRPGAPALAPPTYAAGARSSVVFPGRPRSDPVSSRPRLRPDNRAPPGGEAGAPRRGERQAGGGTALSQESPKPRYGGGRAGLESSRENLEGPLQGGRRAN